MAGCQILNNQVGLQANKYDIMLTVVTMSINRQMKILQTEGLQITFPVINLLLTVKKEKNE